MNLPEIEMVGLKPAQRLLKHSHSEVLIAAVRADLSHQEDAAALALERHTHPVLGLPR